MPKTSSKSGSAARKPAHKGGASAARTDPAQAEALASALFREASAEDLAPYGTQDRAAIARLCLAALLEQPACNRVRVINADPGSAAALDQVTIVQISTKNIPFLLDSTLAAIHGRKIDVQLVLHPVLNIRRDDKGMVCDVDFAAHAGTPQDFVRESFIYLHIARIEQAGARAALAENLEQVLRDVHCAVADWSDMQIRLAQSIATYKHRPPRMARQELAEAIQFLEWIAADNFILLGMREYRFDADLSDGPRASQEASGLGLLADPQVKVLRRGSQFVQMTPEIREFLLRPEPLIIAKANVRSRVHRAVHMDYIGVKLFDDTGKLDGELRIVGLFTESAYTRTVDSIPWLRRKAAGVMEKSGFEEGSHSARALANVLNTYPRDELFQIDAQTLSQFALSILRLAERPRVRILARRDRFDRFVSIICYLPRDRYNTRIRHAISSWLKDIYAGRVSAWYIHYPQGPLVRLHIIIGRDGGTTPKPSQGELEAAIVDIVRSWSDDLRAELRERHAPARAEHLFADYDAAFPASYREEVSPAEAIADVELVDRLVQGEKIAIAFRARAGKGTPHITLNLAHPGTPTPLSARVPILENMGFEVINERTYALTLPGRALTFLHEMTLARRDGAMDDISDDLIARAAEFFLKVWDERAESDALNALVLTTPHGWRDIAILRALSRYLQQIGLAYSQNYIAGALTRNFQIAGQLIDLFHARFDPSFKADRRKARADAIETALSAGLDNVETLDDDRILRSLHTLIRAILRTNLFVKDSPGTDGAFAFKLDPQVLDAVPEPRPFREIFVYSPRVEGVHLRFGKVARGGLRWSDRPEDFRTEILGLVKAQKVKNAVIVPVGAKGGFVAKRLAAAPTREAAMAEGVACYRIFISALLGITDNLEDDKARAPRDLVRYDDDDPYFVVAADKGTATFSDIANEISQGANFWLDDAFASGGSAGYDHKKMGITARGAWEAVKRHFREINRDIQKTPFTAVGVGDMSGDVFGNGMLLSPKTRLLAAFDHRHIFIDPDPDPAISLKERKRLFARARSSWADYNAKLLSKGGGIFPRNVKFVDLSPQARKMLNIGPERPTPQAVIVAILKMPSDLLWFGGIGTYARADKERDGDVEDHANDAIRITARELGAKIVGEGANLGMTQRARIEFAGAGGRCNSDAIDNSAGVNSSDMEVNIKIALARAMQEGVIDRARRNVILQDMTRDVAQLVLANNYEQSRAISTSHFLAARHLGHHIRMIQKYERAGILDRAIEFLPEDADLAEMAQAGTGLSRPELCVLLAYGKLAAHDGLLAGTVPDDPCLESCLNAYFPKKMRKEFGAQITGHRLRREICATFMANAMINQGGPAFLTRLEALTGKSVDEIARAFMAAQEIFAHPDLLRQIDALDNAIDGTVQLSLYAHLSEALVGHCLHLLRHGMDMPEAEPGIAALAGRFKPVVASLSAKFDAIIPERMKRNLKAGCVPLLEAGVPAPLAGQIVQAQHETMLLDIALVTEQTGRPLKEAVATYFEITTHFQIGFLHQSAAEMEVQDYFDIVALDQSRMALTRAHLNLTIKAMAAGGFAAWRAANEAHLRHQTEIVTEIMSGGLNVTKFSIIANLLRAL